VYFKEGWYRNLISVTVFSVSALASVHFGVIWAVYKVDIQGAFGVFAYCYDLLGQCELIRWAVGARAQYGGVSENLVDFYARETEFPSPTLSQPHHLQPRYTHPHHLTNT
jgi:hypothetical protein